MLETNIKIICLKTSINKICLKANKVWGWTGFKGTRIQSNGGLFEHDNATAIKR